MACGLAETVGMAAAVGAAGMTVAVVGEPHDVLSATTTIGLAVLGGVVEGLAVGLVQYRLLRAWLPRLEARRWVGVTVLAAALGWLLGMLPSTLAQWASAGSAGSGSAATTSGPPLWLMPLAGLALGAMMGVGFGAAQAWALRGQVAHPGRWVLANGLGWSLALAVIMTGAAIPSGPWSWPRLLSLGLVTGGTAGLAVGGVTGLFLPALDEVVELPDRLVNRLVCWVLRSPAHRVFSGALVELRMIGRRTGRLRAVPVQYAQADDRLVVWPAHGEQKVWWRNLSAGQSIDVVLRGEVVPAYGCAVPANAAQRPDAEHTYRSRFPRADVQRDDVLVDVRLTARNPEGPDQPSESGQSGQGDRSASANRSSA